MDTAYVERSHLTTRRFNGRLMRKTLAFSKMEMHRVSVAWSRIRTRAAPCGRRRARGRAIDLLCTDVHRGTGDPNRNDARLAAGSRALVAGLRDRRSRPITAAGRRAKRRSDTQRSLGGGLWADGRLHRHTLLPLGEPRVSAGNDSRQTGARWSTRRVCKVEGNYTWPCARFKRSSSSRMRASASCRRALIST